MKSVNDLSAHPLTMSPVCTRDRRPPGLDQSFITVPDLGGLQSLAAVEAALGLVSSGDTRFDKRDRSLACNIRQFELLEISTQVEAQCLYNQLVIGPLW